MGINSEIGQLFESSLFYEGHGTIKFTDSSSVNTDFQIEFTPFGGFCIKSRFVWSSKQKIDSIIFNTKCGQVNISSYIRMQSLDSQEMAILFASEFEFITNNTKPPKYCVLPLTNLITEFDKPQLIKTNKNKLYPHCVINFKYGDKQYWIEPLFDFDQKKSKLESREVPCVITSIMVGECDYIPLDWDSLKQEQIENLLNVLGFATGTFVQNPWIEFRDEDYKLIKRFHYYINPLQYIKGYVVVEGHYSNFYDTENSGGIGELLEKSLTSPSLKEDYLKVSLDLAILAGRKDDFIANKQSYLVRALDAICSYYKVDTQDLSRALNSSYRPQLDTIIINTVASIRSIAKSTVGNDQDILNKIADRIRSAKEKEKHFGLAVQDLLDHSDFQFKDAHVMNDYYKLNPRPDEKNFVAILSRYRGAIIHEGYFDFQNYDFYDVVKIFKHLHDILIRINLKKLNYDGMYNVAATSSSTGQVCRFVNWVDSSTNARDLGY